MNVWGLVFLVFVPAMAVLMIAFAWLSHWSVRRMIGERHRALEEIHLTSRVPSVWTEKYDRKLRSLAGACSGMNEPGTAAERRTAKAASEWNRRKRNKIVAELDGLIDYTRRTKLVAVEDVRLVLLDQLEALRGEWREQGQEVERMQKRERAQEQKHRQDRERREPEQASGARTTERPMPQ